MGDDQVVYRVPTAMITAVTAPVIGVGVLLLVALYVNDSSSEVLVWAGAGWSLFGVVVVALAVRPRTVVSRTGIEVRQAFGTSSLPWAEIGHVEIEQVSPATARFQVFGAVVYDVHERRLVLPYFHDRRLGSALLEVEVDELRLRWEAGRGADWKRGR